MESPVTNSYFVAPTVLVRGRGAFEQSAAEMAALGRHLLWVDGETGTARLPSTLRDGLTAAGARITDARHRGLCTDAAVAEVRAAAELAGVDALIALGGGRVIDVVKAAADDLRLPFAAVATSPATCAAVTPVSVKYAPDGRYQGTRPTRRAPDVAVLDPDLLTGAPDRLLAAGILDTLAKVHEVRRTSGTAAAIRAALAMCHDLEALIDEHAEEAVAAGPTRSDAGSGSGSGLDARSDARTLVAEACVLTPGLIGGLAGEEAKLAAAHPLHNALTALPGSQTALHGELVGFGVLVQIDLSGAGETAVRAEAARFARLGVPCHLEALGCDAARGQAGRAVAAETVGTEPMLASFPSVDADALYDSMLRVDGWSRAEAEHAATRSA